VGGRVAKSLLPLGLWGGRTQSGLNREIFCLAVRTLMMPFAMAARRNSVLPVPRPAKNWLRGRVPDKRQLG